MSLLALISIRFYTLKTLSRAKTLKSQKRTSSEIGFTPFWKTFPWHKQLYDAQVFISLYCIDHYRCLASFCYNTYNTGIVVLIMNIFFNPYLLVFGNTCIVYYSLNRNEFIPAILKQWRIVLVSYSLSRSRLNSSWGGTHMLRHTGICRNFGSVFARNP